MEYQIGDFSRISRLSIKTLRYYHECGLIVPVRIDSDSGYRYYDERSLEKARVISELKELEFSLKEIKDILDNCSDDVEIVGYIEEKAKAISEMITKYAGVQKKLDHFVKHVKHEEELKMLNKNSEIIIKDIPDILIVSLRFKGKYQDVGKAFGKLFKSFGRYSAGAPFCVYHDAEYKEEDADIEACVAVKAEVAKDGIQSKVLKGGKVLSVIHKGPYETIGESYKVLIDYINANNIKVKTSSREIYLKGPGIILPRSPRKFITEIQIMLD